MSMILPNGSFVPERLGLTTALQQMLVAATGRPVGIATAPTSDADANIAADPPYAIIYPIPSTAMSGPYYAYPEQDAGFQYQITSVAIRGDQAEWMGDAVRRAIVGRVAVDQDTISGLFFSQPLDVPGLVVLDRMVISTGGITKVDVIYQMTEDYRINVSTDQTEF
jgi:hypothetical protein